ncbi:protein Aster-B isoform X8 [Tachyglossus aculeatus]|uniref:protein Aster-B isoform X8 n=1 Tax=Tachyglossus aculeatus TaxID=9261 RepID=UPI0018F5B278|nr:protein Aster-B isoform X8 [Tachyglossus aculeatus]
MPAADMTESLQLPALRVPQQPPQGPEGRPGPSPSPAWSSSSTPTLRRRRPKMRHSQDVQDPSGEGGLGRDSPTHSSPGKEFLQLPSIEITPSSDEDAPWSSCSTPSASPRRKRFLLRKWLRVRERKELSESRLLPLLSSKLDPKCPSSLQSSLQSSWDDDSSRFLNPNMWEKSRPGGDFLCLFSLDGAAPPAQAKPKSWSQLIWQQQSTASNSNRSSPACSPILRKRSRSPTPQNPDGDAMVEKGSDHSSDKSPSTPEQGVQRSCSSQSGRSGGKNSKKSQSWYNENPFTPESGTEGS